MEDCALNSRVAPLHPSPWAQALVATKAIDVRQFRGLAFVVHQAMEGHLVNLAMEVRLVQGLATAACQQEGQAMGLQATGPPVAMAVSCHQQKRVTYLLRYHLRCSQILTKRTGGDLSWMSLP